MKVQLHHARSSQGWSLLGHSHLWLPCASTCFTMAPKRILGESQEPGLDITDVHLVWDGDMEVRSRLRDGGNILHPSSGLICDNAVCALNSPILGPILCTMASSPDRKLPSVTDLRSEMTILMRFNKRLGPDVQTLVLAESIHIRKLLSFVKAKVRRHEVSLAVWHQFRICHSLFFELLPL